MTASEARPQYPIGIPYKFSSDGTVQRYPGNTILCHLPADSPLQSGLKTLFAAIESHPTLSSRIHLLPPESWHMTVLDGVREFECEPGMWPPGEEKQSLSEYIEIFTPKLRHLGANLAKEGLAPPYRLRIRNYSPAVVGIGLEIEGQTPEEEKRMKRLRDRLADALGFRAPNHEVYRIHLTVAYLLRHIDGEDKKELDKVFKDCWKEIEVDFELGAVEFCTFEDMHAFKRLFYLS